MQPNDTSEVSRTGLKRFGHGACLVLAGVALSLTPANADSPSGPASLQSFNFPDKYVQEFGIDNQAEIAPATTDAAKLASTFRIVPGLAGSGTVSFESVEYPGYFLRHFDWKVYLNANNGTDGNYTHDASFYPRQGLADQSKWSFESSNNAGKYLRHCNFKLVVQALDSSDLDCSSDPAVGAQDATFSATAPLADRTPPVVTVTASSNVLWPPNGKMVPVAVSGTITDSGPYVSGVDASSVSYAVIDEYGSVQPSGPVTLNAGAYSITVYLQASRNGNDADGRRYVIRVSAKDNAGNAGSNTATVTVPHDQGK